MNISTYPQWDKIRLEHAKELLPAFQKCPTEVSEFTFANVFLFRETYDYHVARLDDQRFILKGKKNDRQFFLLPWGLEDWSLLDELYEEFDYWKNVASPFVEEYQAKLGELDLELIPDRDNFDYLYSREELSKLAGRKFHKKRNHVNSFLKEYPEPERVPLSEDNLGDAHSVLDLWFEQKNEDGDMKASRDALDHREELGLSGAVYYIEGKPVAYVMGEPLGNRLTYIVHFEKADHEIKGLYQYINKDWAGALSGACEKINREQDLGEPGLIQAKMTYRPIGFVEKYRVLPPSHVSQEEKDLLEKTKISVITN